jgi:hypothetical protein
VTGARAVAVLGALAVAFVAACGPGALVRRGRINEDALSVVRRDLAPVRGLAFSRPVPAIVMDREALRGFLVSDLDATYPGEQLHHLERVYVRLGLLPPGVPLRGAFLALMSDEGAGFYDPRTKQLVLAAHAPQAVGGSLKALGLLTGRDLVGEFLVAHELTHALQDQHWGLPTAPEPVLETQGDRALARRALLEGDATLAGFAYLLRGRLDDAAVERAVGAIARTPEELEKRQPDAPAALRAVLAFQYDRGTAFAGRLYQRGGWAAVNAAHADPPASTEQILHPERWDAPRDAPVPIRLGGTRGLERAGFTPVLEDTLGELQLRVLAERTLPPASAATLAAGWGGDRLRALARGDDLVVVWLTAWDTTGDADEFAAAAPGVLADDAWVERRDDTVLVVLPAPGVDPAAVGAAVWTGSCRGCAPAPR